MHCVTVLSLIYIQLLRVQKGHQKTAVKESKPGYSLYTSDSEDQVCKLELQTKLLRQLSQMYTYETFPLLLPTFPCPSPFSMLLCA